MDSVLVIDFAAVMEFHSCHHLTVMMFAKS